MITYDAIDVVENGASFINADLHVHSFGGSSDVKDRTMTVQKIVDAAVKQGISLLSITDHNSDKNQQAALDHAQQYIGQLLVLPGTEITTAHGHLLVYFAPDRIGDLHKFLGKIELVGEMGAQETHTKMSMADVIREAERLGGICIAAHIDRQKTGFEMLAEGYPNWKKDILNSSGLYGLEVDDPTHLVWYSSTDETTPLGAERRKLLESRGKATGMSARRSMAHVQGSDAHSLVAFSSSKPEKPWTRFKLDELSFEAFRTALVDPEARVRARGSIPLSIPRILGMHVTGGFLDGEVFHFSDNLNCFIGGRGTGKSTAIRTLAYCLGKAESFSDFENCPDTVIVYCEDADGIRYRYERQRGCDISVKAKEDQEIMEVPIDAFRIEYYGQGELADVAKDPLNNNALLQDFLDRHINLRDLLERESSLVDQLETNAAQLIPIESSFGQLRGKKQTLTDTNTKLKIAEEGKLQEIVGLQSKVSAEKTLRQSLEQVAQAYTKGLSLSTLERDYDELVAVVGQITGDASSMKLLKSLELKITEANTYLQVEQGQINTKLKAIAKEMTAIITSLKTNHAKIEAEQAIKITDLKNKGLSGNLVELQRLLRQKETLGTEITSVEQRRKELTQLKTDREQLLTELRAVRDEMMVRRKDQLRTINQNLGATLTDYTVFVRYDPSGIIDTFYEFMCEKMNGSYFQDQQILTFCQKVTPHDLAALVRAQDVAGIAKAGAIDDEWATEVQNRLFTWNSIFALEILAKQPCPLITVKTKSTPPKDIPVNQLSDGQRHTILLTIAMLAESNLPLIIDQPEDDLDNAFIFTSIVRTLRSIKERRQVIVVTHNANIAVLGDSELIFPMKRENDCGKSVCRGSIDRKATKETVQSILEGGEVAFRRRKEIYGY